MDVLRSRFSYKSHSYVSCYRTTWWILYRLLMLLCMHMTLPFALQVYGQWCNDYECLYGFQMNTGKWSSIYFAGQRGAVGEGGVSQDKVWWIWGYHIPPLPFMVGSKLNVFHNLNNYMSTLIIGREFLLPTWYTRMPFLQCFISTAIDISTGQFVCKNVLCQAEPSRGYIQEPDRSNIRAYVLLY